MKRLAILLLLITINVLSSKAQQWAFVTATNTNTLSISATGLLATGKDALVVGQLTQKKLALGADAYGSYNITEYDTTGNIGTSINITGKLLLIDAQCDDNGNYYVLGKYYDTATFSTGFQATRQEPSSATTHFLFRLDKHTLTLSWFKPLGVDENSVANYLTIKNGGAYVFVDTAFNTNVLYKFDVATGNSTAILSQKDAGMITSVQVDDHDNIYVAGGGTSNLGINFNGHNVVPSASFSYPNYIVRYKAGGIYDWSQLMGDVTVVSRQLTLGNNNVLYYTGDVFDTFSLGGIHVRRPAWAYDYIVAMLDSSGNVHWLRQLKDTLSGDAQLVNNYHTAISNDGSLSIANGIRHYIDWGNGHIINTNSQSTAAVVNYSPTGAVNWVTTVKGDYTIPGRIASDGRSLWYSGTGFDSTALQFGTFTLPTSHYSYRPFLAKITPGTAGPAAINSQNAPLYASIFPNPAHEHISIRRNTATGKLTTLSMLDITGKNIYTRLLNGSVNETINTDAYARGVYFIEISDNNARYVQKVILE